MPSDLRALRHEILLTLPQDPWVRFQVLADNVTIFQDDIKSGTLNEPKSIIYQALELDSRMAEIFTNVPPGWLYETVIVPYDSEVIWAKQYHIYYDHYIASVWNTMRTVRMRLNESILRHLLLALNSTPPQITHEEFTTQTNTCTNTLIEMRDGILCSVPQHLGFISARPFESPSNIHIDPQHPPEPLPTNLPALFSSPPFLAQTPDFTYNPTPLVRNPLFTGFAAYLFIWPLYAAASTKVSTIEIRAFALRMLDFIGEVVGMRGAKSMSEFLRREIREEILQLRGKKKKKNRGLWEMGEVAVKLEVKDSDESSGGGESDKG